MLNKDYLIHSILDFLSKLPAILALFWIGYAFYVASQRENPVIITSASIQEEHIHPGMAVTVDLSIDRRRRCDFAFIQNMYDINQVRYLLPSIMGSGHNFRPLGPGHYKFKINIPADMPKGPAVYEATRQYTCNWTQVLVPLYEEVPDIHFNVE